MNYFFTITFDGLNKNGNSKYKVTGFKPSCYPLEFETLNNVFLQEIIGGRLYKNDYIITTQTVQQITEKLTKRFQDKYAFAVVGR